MKKIWILLLCILPMIAFTSCNKEDDIRKDIDDLNARLDALATDLESLNVSIKSFQDVARGLVMITGYEMDEKGNYTLSLSDGKKLTVYSGQPAGEIPTLGINEAGNWTYTLNEKTVELKDGEGNPCPAVPADGADGQTPQISIDADGYWCYTIAGVTKRVEGRYNVADIEKIPGSIFADVTVVDHVIQFKFPGNEALTKIPLLGGLNLTFADHSGTVTSVKVAKNGSVTLTAVQTEVEQIIIDPTPLKIGLDGTTGNLTIQTKGVNPGAYMVYFQIFSKEGYRLIKSLEVIVAA